MDNKKEIIVRDNSVVALDTKISIVEEIANYQHLIIYEYAKRFFNLGLNVTCIHQEKSEANQFAKDRLKHPYHEYKELSYEKQLESEFKSFEWKKSVGVGTVAGFNDLIVVDVDDCKAIRFINLLIDKLGLPEKYEWITESGSRAGFHILIRVEKPEELSEQQVVTTYKPKEKIKHIFGKIELLWNTHVVLPPSLHKSGDNYSFMNAFPTSLPHRINTDKLISTIEMFCESETKKVGKGYRK